MDKRSIAKGTCSTRVYIKRTILEGQIRLLASGEILFVETYILGNHFEHSLALKLFEVAVIDSQPKNSAWSSQGRVGISGRGGSSNQVVHLRIYPRIVSRVYTAIEIGTHTASEASAIGTSACMGSVEESRRDSSEVSDSVLDHEEDVTEVLIGAAAVPTLVLELYSALADDSSELDRVLESDDDDDDDDEDGATIGVRRFWEALDTAGRAVLPTSKSPSSSLLLLPWLSAKKGCRQQGHNMGT